MEFILFPRMLRIHDLLNVPYHKANIQLGVCVCVLPVVCLISIKWGLLCPPEPIILLQSPSTSKASGLVWMA